MAGFPEPLERVCLHREFHNSPLLMCSQLFQKVEEENERRAQQGAASEQGVHAEVASASASGRNRRRVGGISITTLGRVSPHDNRTVSALLTWVTALERPKLIYSQSWLESLFTFSPPHPTFGALSDNIPVHMPTLKRLHRTTALPHLIQGHRRRIMKLRNMTTTM